MIWPLIVSTMLYALMTVDRKVWFDRVQFDRVYVFHMGDVFISVYSVAIAIDVAMHAYMLYLLGMSYLWIYPALIATVAGVAMVFRTIHRQAVVLASLVWFLCLVELIRVVN